MLRVNLAYWSVHLTLQYVKAHEFIQIKLVDFSPRKFITQADKNEFVILSGQLEAIRNPANWSTSFRKKRRLMIIHLQIQSTLI